MCILIVRGATLMDRIILGERIKHLRESAGLTLKGLGSLCGGWTRSRIGNYETAERTPSIEDFITIAEELKKIKGNDAYFYLLTGKYIPEFLAESNYKTPYTSFTPDYAVEVMKSVLDIAQEVGMINFKDKEKPSELMALFAKKCNERVISSSNS
jgi:transcriptional regulator with XRE-family HTH domain